MSQSLLVERPITDILQKLPIRDHQEQPHYYSSPRLCTYFQRIFKEYKIICVLFA